jgi:hypothetical protein
VLYQLSYTSRKNLGTDPTVGTDTTGARTTEEHTTDAHGVEGHGEPFLRSEGVESQHLNAQKRNEAKIRSKEGAPLLDQHPTLIKLSLTLNARLLDVLATDPAGTGTSYRVYSHSRSDEPVWFDRALQASSCAGPMRPGCYGESTTAAPKPGTHRIVPTPKGVLPPLPHFIKTAPSYGRTPSTTGAG